MFFFSSRRRHPIFDWDWSSDVCSSDLIRCFMGGALDAETLREDDEDLVARARRELGAALGVTAEPVLVRASRWPAAMPQRSEERRVGKECRSRWSPYH